MSSGRVWVWVLCTDQTFAPLIMRSKDGTVMLAHKNHINPFTDGGHFYVILVTLAYMEGWTDVRTYGRSLMTSQQKPKFLALMGYHIFLTIPSVSQERRGDKSSNFIVILLFVTLKTY